MQNSVQPPGSSVLRYGPFDGTFISSGLGLRKKLPAEVTADGSSPWTMYGWVNEIGQNTGRTLLAGVGDAIEGSAQRYLVLEGGRLACWLGGNTNIVAKTSLKAEAWHFIAATFDGKSVLLYSDGVEVAQGEAGIAAVAPLLQLAPADPSGNHHFSGRLFDFTFVTSILSGEELKRTMDGHSEFELSEYEAGSKTWPIQTRAQAGYRAPQDPSTLPKSAAPFSRPVAKSTDANAQPLQSEGENRWKLGAWRLAAGPDVADKGDRVSQTGFATTRWYAATVPGTVLTTLIDQGVYPDPDFGLNNLAIPEKLNKQSYWYRTEFQGPATAGRRLTLTFAGINYAAEVWMNGRRLGTVTGAFKRGLFDITDAVSAGKRNALAVKIDPPPHPGIPQEQSVKGGPGENGGAMCLDGPTFIDTEGWDWIPAIRDRNIGLWQDVTLTASGAVTIGDAQVITSLPLPDTSNASVSIKVPLHNEGAAASAGVLKISFEGVEISKHVTVAPGDSTVAFEPAEFSQLSIAHPRLWWPNGYGKPELYHLKLSFDARRGESDSKALQFGIREITYELSLLDATGHLRRVEYSPTRAGTAPVVNVSHEGMIESASGWVASIQAGAESSPSLRPGESPSAGTK